MLALLLCTLPAAADGWLRTDMTEKLLILQGEEASARAARLSVFAVLHQLPEGAELPRGMAKVTVLTCGGDLGGSWNVPVDMAPCEGRERGTYMLAVSCGCRRGGLGRERVLDCVCARMQVHHTCHGDRSHYPSNILSFSP